MCAAGRINEVEHSSGEEGPGHVGEGEEQKPAAAEGVDCPDGRPSKGEVDKAESEGGEEGGDVGGAGVGEDCGGVEGYDVY